MRQGPRFRRRPGLTRVKLKTKNVPFLGKVDEVPAGGVEGLEAAAEAGVLFEGQERVGGEEGVAVLRAWASISLSRERSAMRRSMSPCWRTPSISPAPLI